MISMVFSSTDTSFAAGWDCDNERAWISDEAHAGDLSRAIIQVSRFRPVEILAGITITSEASFADAVMARCFTLGARLVRLSDTQFLPESGQETCSVVLSPLTWQEGISHLEVAIQGMIAVLSGHPTTDEERAIYGRMPDFILPI